MTEGVRGMRKELELDAEVTERMPQTEKQTVEAEIFMPRKRFWRVRAVTDELGTHPDIPDGIPWAGNTDGEIYVIVTPPEYEVPNAEEISFEEASRAFSRMMDGISGDDVGEKWGVS